MFVPEEFGLSWGDRDSRWQQLSNSWSEVLLPLPQIWPSFPLGSLNDQGPRPLE